MARPAGGYPADMTEREHEPAESARPSVGPRDRPDAIRPDDDRPDGDEEPDRKLPPDEDEPDDGPRPAPH
ncbi:hypothetical protein BJF90_43570 [Pseudonocardia sp. CNS-004]|nr:hypothetical protein BJF90_43570 [Pseudonocardia sp. CNS-004]